MNISCYGDESAAMVIDQTSDRLDWLTTAVLLAWVAMVRVAS